MIDVNRLMPVTIYSQNRVALEKGRRRDESDNI